MREQKTFAITVGEPLTVGQYQGFLDLVLEKFKNPEFKAAFEEWQKGEGERWRKKY